MEVLSAYADYSFEELKDECRMRGIACRGKAATLISKLEADDRAKATPPDKMRIYVRTLMGFVHTIHCSREVSVEEFKQLVEEKTGIDADSQRLYLICGDEPGVGDLIIPDILGGQMTGKRITEGTLVGNGAHSGMSIRLEVSLIKRKK